MKVTINIDCTPEEARAFMGLPDLQPIQQNMLAEMEKRMMAEMERFSPEGMMKLWFSALPQGTDALRDFVGGFMPGGRNADDKK
jgi:hypothetical protein